ncbi:hypothetical protein NQ318_008822 [Aromia moschata]|uniref:Uncharacterized protein n=1 Tax=Aromia moschata TaxID=1265417 RepID=A0AAV8ZA55_9CUCU|nr:hypothetical protein NQ318_008822 [Aromia moschata]
MVGTYTKKGADSTDQKMTTLLTVLTSKHYLRVNSSCLYLVLHSSSSTRHAFEWVQAKAECLHVDFINKHLVLGGVEDGGLLNIGRVMYQNQVIVGKVCGFNIGKALLYFTDTIKREELSADSYEVLFLVFGSLV